MLQPQVLEVTRQNLNELLVLARKQLDEVCQFSTKNFGVTSTVSDAITFSKTATSAMNLTAYAQYIENLLGMRDSVVEEISRMSEEISNRHLSMLQSISSFAMPKFKSSGKGKAEE